MTHTPGPWERSSEYFDKNFDDFKCDFGNVFVSFVLIACFSLLLFHIFSAFMNLSVFVCFSFISVYVACLIC